MHGPNTYRKYLNSRREDPAAVVVECSDPCNYCCDAIGTASTECYWWGYINCGYSFWHCTDPYFCETPCGVISPFFCGPLNCNCSPGYMGCDGQICGPGDCDCGSCTFQICRYIPLYWWQTAEQVCEDFGNLGSCTKVPGGVVICYNQTVQQGCLCWWGWHPESGSCPCCAGYFEGQGLPPVIPPTIPPIGPDNGYYSCPIEKSLDSVSWTCRMSVVTGNSFPTQCLPHPERPEGAQFTYDALGGYYSLDNGTTSTGLAYLCVEYGVKDGDSARLQILAGKNRYRYTGIHAAYYTKGFYGCTGPYYPNGYDDFPLLKFGLTSMGDIERGLPGGTFPIADSRMDLPLFGATTRNNPNGSIPTNPPPPPNCPPCAPVPEPPPNTIPCIDDPQCFNCRTHDTAGNNEGIGHYGPYPGQAPWNYGTTAGFYSFDCFNANSSLSVKHKATIQNQSVEYISYSVDIPPVSIHSYIKGMEDWLRKFVEYKSKAFFQSINNKYASEYQITYDDTKYQQLTLTFGNDNWWNTLDPSLTNGAGTNNVAHVLDLLKYRVENLHLYVTGSSNATIPWNVGDSSNPLPSPHGNSSDISGTECVAPGCNPYSDPIFWRIYGRTSQGKLDTLGITGFYVGLFRNGHEQNSIGTVPVDEYYTTNEYQFPAGGALSNNTLSRFYLQTPNVFLWDRAAFQSASTADKWKYVYFPGQLNTLFDSGCTTGGLVSNGGDPPVISGTRKQIVKLDETGHSGNGLSVNTPNSARVVQWLGCNRTLDDLDSNTFLKITQLGCDGQILDGTHTPISVTGFCEDCCGIVGTVDDTFPCMLNTDPFFRPMFEPNCNTVGVQGLLNQDQDSGCTMPIPAVDFIAAGMYHSALITEADKILHCWGSNESGQSSIPTQIRDFQFAQVACGAEHTVALTYGQKSGNRSVYCWGNNTFGQCGGSAASQYSGVTVRRGVNPDCGEVLYGDEIRFMATGSVCDFDSPPEDQQVSKIVAGPYYTLTLLSDGTLTGWGDNRYGQLNIPNKTFTDVNAFGNTVIATDITNSVFVWGATASGLLENFPMGVSGFSDPVDKIAAGGDTGGNSHALLASNSHLYVFGNNNWQQGQIPSLLKKPPYSFEFLSAGKYHSAALTKSSGGVSTTRDVYCWGRNEEGQCNIPDALDYTKDANINGQIKMIVCGGYHTLALTDPTVGGTGAGLVFGWGNNAYGQSFRPSCVRPRIN